MFFSVNNSIPNSRFFFFFSENLLYHFQKGKETVFQSKNIFKGLLLLVLVGVLYTFFGDMTNNSLPNHDVGFFFQDTCLVSVFCFSIVLWKNRVSWLPCHV